MQESESCSHTRPHGTTSPISIRIEACSLCQLRCVLCPSARGETLPVIGRGWLKAADFEHLLEQNPQIRRVELGNFGEVFLNPEFPQILRCAFERGVITEIDEGANFNHVSDEALEALVRYQTSVVRCAIDGATQETYRRYRVGGDLRKVVRNIQALNRLKHRYGSDKPHLIFQFVIFGHNEHEIEAAGALAQILQMEIRFKLNFMGNCLPVRDRQRVRACVGYADREEYLQSEGRHYQRHQCYEMWDNPQINWDGKLLGCSRNFWGWYAENVFTEGLTQSLNNERISRARLVLMGGEEAGEDSPCSRCGVYRSMREREDWITEAELRERPSREILQPSQPTGRTDQSPGSRFPFWARRVPS
jgi:MoaA/NifB/PqqE/SkfB family radical SAM enzyme